MKEQICNVNSEHTEEADFEKVIDEIVDMMRKAMKEGGSQETIINYSMTQRVVGAYRILSEAVKGTKTEVTYALHSPHESMGVVRVTGDDLSFDDASPIIEVAKLAANFDVYPKTNGTVQMVFTFHDLTQTIQ